VEERALRAVHTATFDAQGGTASHARVRRYTAAEIEELPSLAKAVYSTALGAQLPFASREGYVFDGWYTEADGGERVDAQTPVAQDVTYYAHWAAERNS